MSFERESARVLVTGATGFIGRHLCNRLLQLDYDIVPVSLGGGEVSGRKVFKLDLRDNHEVGAFLREIPCSVIFHLGAFIPDNPDECDAEECVQINGMGTYYLLKAAIDTGARKFIYASSDSVYSRKQVHLPVDESQVSPSDHYSASKFLGENFCEIARHGGKIQTISLRYSSVYGPGQSEQSVLPIFVHNVLKLQSPTVWGSGVRTQDFVYIKDVIEVTISAGFGDVTGVFNIGSGIETSMRDLAQAVIMASGNPDIKIRTFPVSREDRTRFCLDISLARYKLNYKPQFSLLRGLKDYFQEIQSPPDAFTPNYANRADRRHSCQL